MSIRIAQLDRFTAASRTLPEFPFSILPERHKRKDNPPKLDPCARRYECDNPAP
jgi:hypothetical protein